MTETVASVALGITLFVGLLLLERYADRRYTCDCGKARPMCYDATHEQAWLMWGKAGIMISTTIICVLFVAPLGAVIYAVLSVLSVRRAWFHDRDRGKPNPAKALGKVVADHHGRLKVAT